ncbi:MAG: rane protein required for colicin production [Candidatus Cloacimonadota bacterium]|nr:rane protein required for colicin production [Candidatus Cloacimonadota bacterium]MDK2850972.1 rane protein required for colicin production [Candidatus Cloacimonadota bacterium]
MGVIDWIILAVILIFTILGIRRGLVGAVVQFAGAILAFLLIGHYYPLLANQLMLKYELSKTLAILISVILILVLVVVVIRFVIWILDRFIKALRLSWLNRFLGGVLGLVNGLILVVIFAIVMDYAPRLSEPLRDYQNHRVYTGIDTLKDDVVKHLKMNNYFQYLTLPEFLKLEKNNSNDRS